MNITTGKRYIYTGKKAQQTNGAVALKEYCNTLISHIKQKDLPEYKERQKQRKCIITPTEAISNQSVPEHLICTLKLKTFKEEIKKRAEQDFHDPSRCIACLSKEADLALDFFIRKKTSQVQKQLLEEKIQYHLCNKDTVCLLGDMLKNMPRPSEEPSEIWKKLLSNESRILHDNK